MYLVLDHQKKKKFFNPNYTKYNKKPGFTSQQTQEKYKTKLWIKKLQHYIYELFEYGITKASLEPYTELKYPPRQFNILITPSIFFFS